MPLQAMYGCVECLYNVQSYLTIRDVNSFHATCKFLRQQLMDQYYKEKLRSTPTATSINVHCVNTQGIGYKLPFINSLGLSEDTIIISPTTSFDDTFYYKRFFIALIGQFLDPDKLIYLSDDIFSVSSVDRAEERPFNCLKVSRCYLNFTSHMKILRLTRYTEEFDNIKYHIGTA